MPTTRFYRMVCDVCDQWQILPSSAKGRKCHMTPKCSGKMTQGEWFRFDQLSIPWERPDNGTQEA